MGDNAAELGRCGVTAGRYFSQSEPQEVFLDFIYRKKTVCKLYQSSILGGECSLKKMVHGKRKYAPLVKICTSGHIRR